MNSGRSASFDQALLFELDALRARAARVLDEHTNDDGACRGCGHAFPCLNACLADHNLILCREASLTITEPDRAVSEGAERSTSAGNSSSIT
jgi:hypothetical protein